MSVVRWCAEEEVRIGRHRLQGQWLLQERCPGFFQYDWFNGFFGFDGFFQFHGFDRFHGFHSLNWFGLLGQCRFRVQERAIGLGHLIDFQHPLSRPILLQGRSDLLRAEWIS